MRDLVAAGDLTDDGKADLLARDGARALWLYPGNGKAAFGAQEAPVRLACRPAGHGHQ